MEDYREVVTTALDVLAVLLVAFGVAAALFPWFGWASVGAGGVVLWLHQRGMALAASVAEWRRERAS